MTIKLQLHAAWSKRAKLRVESDKLWAEGDKLWAEGAKLWVESDKLRAESDKLWAEAIIEMYGNIRISWSRDTPNGECTLENGDIYDENQEED